MKFLSQQLSDYHIHVVLDNDDLVLGEFRILDVLPPGAMYTQSETVTIPKAIFGDFFIIVDSDIHNQVYEHNNEEDNARVSDVSNMSTCKLNVHMNHEHSDMIRSKSVVWRLLTQSPIELPISPKFSSQLHLPLP